MGDQAPGFGTQLRRYRERAGLSQEALAERAQLTVAGLAALERGRRQRPYPATVRRLADALGLSADERTAFTARSAAPERAGSDSLAVARWNLPVPRAALIGRAQELAALTALVPSYPGRLVTLTGIGGGGKTRLALAVAAAVRGAFPDGVWLVELAAIADPALVPEAVANALGLPDLAGVPALTRVLEALQARSLLLLLDNCEHLIVACADLCERVLARCPGVRVLATSREPLQLPSERQWRVPPLALPPVEDARSLPAIAASAAVMLFVERAGSVDPSFCLTSENASAVAQICLLLGGLPLALELAAARVRVLAVAQIRDRLDDSLRLLVGSGRAAPTRQQTMRATLDWSYALLTAPEQALFRGLAVFAGSFDLTAAEGVCVAPDLPAEAVLDQLTQLVDKSLVLVEQGAAAARYRLLEPLRQYAAQRCASDELEVAQARHAAHYLALAERVAPLLGGPEQVPWLARLEAESSNLRAALSWAEHHASADVFLRVVTALAPFWEGRGHLSEGQHWLQTALTRSTAPALPPVMRARAQLAAGRLAMLQTDLDTAAAWLGQSLTVARTEDDQWLAAEALTWLGLVRLNQGAVAEGVRLQAESLALAEAAGHAPGIAVALLSLGTALRFQGDTVRSGILLAESLKRFRALGDVRHGAMACTMLGFTCYEQGELTRADALLREGLAGHQAVGDRAFMMYSLMDLAAVRAAQDQAPRAARLLGAMAALRAALGAPLSPTSQGTYARIEAAVRSRLGEADFTAAWEEGRALPYDVAVALALEQTPPAPADVVRGGSTPRRGRSQTAGSTTAAAPARTGVTASTSPAEPLTPRERQVVRLLAEGGTDRQIAATLAISTRTVGVHVQHVMAKLGVHSRWQVADWAHAHGNADAGAR